MPDGCGLGWGAGERRAAGLICHCVKTKSSQSSLKVALGSWQLCSQILSNGAGGGKERARAGKLSRPLGKGVREEKAELCSQLRRGNRAREQRFAPARPLENLPRKGAGGGRDPCSPGCTVRVNTIPLTRSHPPSARDGLLTTTGRPFPAATPGMPRASSEAGPRGNSPAQADHELGWPKGQAGAPDTGTAGLVEKRPDFLLAGHTTEDRNSSQPAPPPALKARRSCSFRGVRRSKRDIGWGRERGESHACRSFITNSNSSYASVALTSPRPRGGATFHHTCQNQVYWPSSSPGRLLPIEPGESQKEERQSCPLGHTKLVSKTTAQKLPTRRHHQRKASPTMPLQPSECVQSSFATAIIAARRLLLQRRGCNSHALKRHFSRLRTEHRRLNFAGQGEGSLSSIRVPTLKKARDLHRLHRRPPGSAAAASPFRSSPNFVPAPHKTFPHPFLSPSSLRGSSKGTAPLPLQRSQPPYLV